MGTANQPKCKQCRKRRRHVRGLCMACYMTVRRSIKAKEITEEKAIQEGLIDKPKYVGPRSKLRRKIASMKRR